MHILGINAYHGGASTAILRDGQFLAAVEDENFRRQKYCAEFPSRSIQFCLEASRILGLRPRSRRHLSRFEGAPGAKSSLRAAQAALVWGGARPGVEHGAVRDIKPTLCRALELDKAGLKAQFHRVEHYRAHGFGLLRLPPLRASRLSGRARGVGTPLPVGLLVPLLHRRQNQGSAAQ